MASLTSCIVIPARLESSRLPRKLLLCESGKPLIQHTYEAACDARKPENVIVAADCEEIAQVVRGFGGRVELTNPAHASGTDRVAEVAAKLSAEIVVNVQGDEPEIPGGAIDTIIGLLESRPETNMATLAAPLRSKEQLFDRSCVKVVFDGGQRALYFSRSPIPHAADWDSALSVEPPLFHQHIGVYAYRRQFLLQLAHLPRSPLEASERLEQLRVLETAETFLVAVIPQATNGIDTPADYAKFVRRVRTVGEPA